MTEPLIELENVTVYSGAHCVLRDVSLKLWKGRHVAILGPNGAGKTSLIRVLNGELRPVWRGHPPPIRLRGRTLYSVWDHRRRLGLVSPELQQQFASRSIPGREVVLSGFFGTVGVYDRSNPEKKARVEEVVEQLGLQDLADKPARCMSTGELRKCLIGRAMVHQPDLLILDEPTAGLDIASALLFRSWLGKLTADSRTIVLVTHQPQDLIPEIGYLVFLREGRVAAAGLRRELLTSSKLSRLFGVPLQVRHRGSEVVVWPVDRQSKS